MKFALFWRMAIDEFSRKREMYTLAYEKQFSAQYIDTKFRIFPESTMTERNISQEDFINVWEQAKNSNPGEQFVQTNYKDITRNASYILTIMKYILKDEKIE